MKTLSPNIKISKWINSGIFISLQVLKNEEKLPKQYLDFLFFIQCLPLNSNNQKGDEILFKRKELFDIISKRNKRIKFPIYYMGEKINNPFKLFFKILSYNKKPVIQHIEGDVYRLKNIYDNLKLKTPYQRLFKVLVNDKLFKNYSGDFSKLRRDAIFLSLLELVKLTPEIIVTEYQLKNIFGINSHDIGNFCKSYGIDKEIIYQPISNIEEQKLNLIPSNSYDEECIYEIPIGFTLEFKEKHLNRLIKKLSDKLGMYQINYRVLYSIKTRIEENKIMYYDVEDFNEDMQKEMEELIYFEETKEKNILSPKFSMGRWSYNKSKRMFRILNEDDPSKLKDVSKQLRKSIEIRP